jgi:hypothetical protein
MIAGNMGGAVAKLIMGTRLFAPHHFHQFHHFHTVDSLYLGVLNNLASHK